MMGTRRRWVFLVLAFIFLVVAVAFTTWRLSLGSSNRARLKAIADRGEPVDVVALNLSYKSVPDEENAAHVWLSGVGQMAAAARAQETWNRLKMPSRGTNFSAEDLDFARDTVGENEAALATFRQAAALPASRYPANLTLGINTLLPHLAPLKSAARLLQAEAVVAAADGDSRRAADAVSTMLALSRSLAPEPLLISQLVGYSIDTMAFTTAEYLLTRTSFTDQQLAEMTSAFAAAEDTNSLSRGLMGERANFVTIGKDPQTFLASGRPWPRSHTMADTIQQLVWPIVRGSGFLERDFAFGIDALSTNIALARLPDPYRFQSRTNWDLIEVRAREGRYILSSLLLPALSKAVNRDTEDRARARLAQTALAVERYRLAYNRVLPPNLDALVPKYLPMVLMDPFHGQPLRFKALNNGYVVYSVGADTQDDDGLERRLKAKDKDPWDITFIVEPPR